MLRPATPLSVLLLISFVLLLISTISTPIVRGIPLARTQNVNFGVFGWTKDTGETSGIQIGWNTDEALPANADQNFNLPSSARHSLSSLLIVHPIAAFCNLIVLALALAAHFHSPSHSARYLLALLVLMLPTMLVTLLAFLVDILLFVPYMAWGGWIVLASTILITASGVVTCAMRRTLVSRKARKRRIAENAEMSGENFYARQAQETKIPPPAMSTESKAPLVNGSPDAEFLPSHPTYHVGRPSEENRSVQPMSVAATSPVDGTDRYYSAPARSFSRPRPTDFSAPLGAPEAYSERGVATPYSTRGTDPYGPRGGRGRGNPRGGYAYRGPPPPGAFNARGGYPNRGRGGFAPGRGGYPIGSRGSDSGSGRLPEQAMGRRQPPPGYPPEDGQGSPVHYSPPRELAGPVRSVDPDLAPYTQDPEMAREGSAYGAPDAVAYGGYGSRNQSPARSRASPYGSRGQSPSGGLRQRSPPPAMPTMAVNRVREMHQGSGNPRMVNEPYDSDISGMVDMQRDNSRIPSPPRHEQESYVPVRAGWSDTHHATTVPGSYSPTSQHRPIVNRARVNSGGSDYYEDVNDRFQNQPAPPTLQSYPPDSHLLASGRPSNHLSPDLGLPLPHSHSYEDLPGARSPAESETSNFTSISQRQPNVNYRPGYGGEFSQLGPAGRPPPQRQDVLLAGNPDFELPGMAPRGRGGMRNRGGMMMGNGGMGRPPPPPGVGPEGRLYNAPPSGVGGMREI